MKLRGSVLLLAVMLVQGCAAELRRKASCPLLDIDFVGVKDQGSLQARGEFTIRSSDARSSGIPLGDLGRSLVDDYYVRVLRRDSASSEWREDDPDLGHSRAPAGALELEPGGSTTFYVKKWLFSDQPTLPAGEFAILFYNEDFTCRSISAPFTIR